MISRRGRLHSQVFMQPAFVTRRHTRMTSHARSGSWREVPLEEAALSSPPLRRWTLAARGADAPARRLAALSSQQVTMPIVASELVQQDEVLERVKLLQELFVKELEIARIDYRLAQDWSGDSSIFFDVVLKRATLPAAVIARLSKAIAAALLREVRSEELGLHAYFNFVSQPENG